MAYQNVGTPRFYVSILQWLKSLGLINYTGSSLDWDGNLFELLDVSPSIKTADTTEAVIGMDFINYTSEFTPASLMPTKKNFFMTLGHNFASVEMEAFFITDADTEMVVASNDMINGTFGAPWYNGFSISTGNDAGDLGANFKFLLVGRGGDLPYANDIKIGSVLYGTYYDMPHSPNLSLTMARDMDGVRRIRTKGGADLTNYKYIKPTKWGQAGAWELYATEGELSNQELSRTGRRSWNLSFSYLNSSDIFPDVSSLRNYGTVSPDGTIWNDAMNLTDNTILNEDTFYSQVIHKTNGGQLPFVFQPDNNNHNADQFAICKLDMNSFKFKQVSNTIYDISLKIKEVW